MDIQSKSEIETETFGQKNLKSSTLLFSYETNLELALSVCQLVREDLKKLQTKNIFPKNLKLPKNNVKVLKLSFLFILCFFQNFLYFPLLLHSQVLISCLTVLTVFPNQSSKFQSDLSVFNPHTDTTGEVMSVSGTYFVTRGTSSVCKQRWAITKLCSIERASTREGWDGLGVFEFDPFSKINQICRANI